MNHNLVEARRYSEGIVELGKRATYMDNMEALSKLTSRYRFMNRGLAVRVLVPGGYVDYWPSTDKWLVGKNDHSTHEVRQYGFIEWLEKELEGEQGYRDEVVGAGEEGRDKG